MVKKKEKIKLRKAVSLHYKPAVHEAPVLTAKGQGFIAEKIIALARKYHIPIKDDPDLIEILYQLDLDQTIPVSLYRVVAEIFAFIYSLNKKYQEQQRYL